MPRRSSYSIILARQLNQRKYISKQELRRQVLLGADEPPLRKAKKTVKTKKRVSIQAKPTIKKEDINNAVNALIEYTQKEKKKRKRKKILLNLITISFFQFLSFQFHEKAKLVSQYPSKYPTHFTQQTPLKFV